VSIKQRESIRNLPCLFAGLVEKYNEVGLKPCETNLSQRWRHASTQDTARRLTFYHDHFPELSDLYSSLDSYSLCERHYNQVIVTDQLSQHLKVPDRIKDSDSALMKTMHTLLLTTLMQSLRESEDF